MKIVKLIHENVEVINIDSHDCYTVTMVISSIKHFILMCTGIDSFHSNLWIR